MTAGERLVQLAGTTGVASVLLLMIGTGITTGEALVDYSQLSTGTAAEHLLVDRVLTTKRPGGVGSKKKRIFVEEDGKILLFKNASQAAQWIAAQKTLEAPIADTSEGRRTVKTAKPIPTPQVIHVAALESLSQRFYPDYNKIGRLIAAQEFDFLLRLQAKLIEKEDEEIIILLMEA